MGYTFNEDGTVTRSNVPNNSSNYRSSNNNSNSGNKGSDSNSGCFVWIGLLAIIGIIIGIVNSNKSNSNPSYSYYGVDSVACDTDVIYNNYYAADTIYADTVLNDDYYSSSLDVSNSNVRLSWEEQVYRINVYSSSSWWINVNTDSWITLRCEGTQIIMYIEENTNEDSRSDYFVIKNDDGLTKRVNIYQD